MRKKTSYATLLRPTRLLISEKSDTYTIIWQVRVLTYVPCTINVQKRDKIQYVTKNYTNSYIFTILTCSDTSVTIL